MRNVMKLAAVSAFALLASAPVIASANPGSTVAAGGVAGNLSFGAGANAAASNGFTSSFSGSGTSSATSGLSGSFSQAHSGQVYFSSTGNANNTLATSATGLSNTASHDATLTTNTSGAHTALSGNYATFGEGDFKGSFTNTSYGNESLSAGANVSGNLAGFEGGIAKGFGG